MELPSVFFLIIYSLGAIQGLFFGVILYRGIDSQNKTANKILSFILFALSYRLIIQCLKIFGIGHYDTWYYFMIDVNWVFGPLLFFYTRAIVVPGKKLSKGDWIHFLPLLIQIGISEFVRLQNLYWDGARESLSWLGYWGYVAWMNMPTVNLVASAIIVIYSIKSLRLLARQKALPTVKEDNSLWIKRIIISFAIYFSVILGILVIDLSSAKDLPWYFHFEQFYYYPYFIGLAILTYWLGFEGYKRRNQVGFLFRSELSSTDKTQLDNILSTVKEAMVKEQLFKDPELSLNSLAEKVGVKAYLITKSLSEIEGTSFRDFLNLYRLEEFKRMMNAPEAKNFDLLSLALEVGFNSKSSFNRAVKKHYGLLPSELRASS